MHQFSSVTPSYPTLCNPMDCSTSGFPVHHQLQEIAQTLSIELVMPSNHLILCQSLVLLPSIFPSIMVFSNESVLCITWAKYWSFSFSISPSIYCLYWNIFHILLILESHILLSYIGNLANTAINTGVQIPFRISVFVSFGETFRREIAGFMVVLFLIF